MKKKTATKKTTRKRSPRQGGASGGSPARLGLEAFQTRARANEGFRLPLVTAEGGSSQHWLLIVGIDSDAFHKAKAGQAEKMAKLGTIENEEEREEATLDALCAFLALVVLDWSFDKADLMPAGAELYPCDTDTVAQFLREAPQIRQQVDKLISKRSLFFRMQAANVKTTPKGSLH